MALSVFGVGFGRSGTESLKKALEILGFGPCYHKYEVLPDQDRVDLWVSLAQGATPDWEAVFDGYNASVDWPGAHCWREIAGHFQSARLILSGRDADSWYRSMANTILPVLDAGTDPNSLGNQMFIPQTFEGNIDDPEHVKDVFNRHNAAVRAAFGPDRLLVYELGSGWEPICNFLGVDVPDMPYPRGNNSDEFEDNFNAANEPRLGSDG